jgi:hypothetical protein
MFFAFLKTILSKHICTIKNLSENIFLAELETRQNRFLLKLDALGAVLVKEEPPDQETSALESG